MLYIKTPTFSPFLVQKIQQMGGVYVTTITQKKRFDSVFDQTEISVNQ